MLLSLKRIDRFELPSLAKKLDDLHLRLYATPGTGAEIAATGIDVTIVDKLGDSDQIMRLLENHEIDYIIYTASHKKQQYIDCLLYTSRCV